MDCDPKEIARLAKCWCFDRATWRSVMVYLACQWAKKKEPGESMVWAPDSEQIPWVDSSGPHVGNLATFLATADIPTVVLLNPIHNAISSISGFRSLPSLQVFGSSDHWTVTALDFSGCNNLITLPLDTGGTLTSLIVNNLPSLVSLTCPLNQLPSLDVSGCPNLTTLDCSLNQLGTLNITGDFAITTLDFSFNPGVTIIGP